MPGERNLASLVRTMQPVPTPDEYVFCSIRREDRERLSCSPIMEFQEQEGLTLILNRSEAERNNLPFIYPCRLITLNIHSSLEAVGFLAAITKHLAAAGISVNAVSAYFHDHLFVPVDRADEALALLQALADSAPLPTVKETTARAIIMVEQQLLVMYFPPKDICFVPGGRVENGEDLVSALARELTEELPDFSFNIGHELGVITHHWRDSDHIRETEHHFFCVTSSDLRPSILPPQVEPPLQFRWIPYAALHTSNVTPPSLPQRIEEFLRGEAKKWNETDGIEDVQREKETS